MSTHKNDTHQSDFNKHQDVSSIDLLSNNEVYDETDQEQWIQLAEQASYQERARKANAPEFDPEFDGVHCIECDAEIPAARLKLHKIRCVDCQEELEKLNLNRR